MQRETETWEANRITIQLIHGKESLHADTQQNVIAKNVLPRNFATHSTLTLSKRLGCGECLTEKKANEKNNNKWINEWTEEKKHWPLVAACGICEQLAPALVNVLTGALTASTAHANRSNEIHKDQRVSCTIYVPKTLNRMPNVIIKYLSMFCVSFEFNVKHL